MNANAVDSARAGAPSASTTRSGRNPAAATSSAKSGGVYQWSVQSRSMVDLSPSFSTRSYRNVAVCSRSVSRR